MRRQFVFKGNVSIRSLTEVMTVDPYLAVAIDAVEVNEHQLAFRGFRNVESLAIPSQAAGQGPSAGASRIPFIEFPFDAPVVWQIQPPPLCIIKVRALAVDNVAKM